MVKCPFCQFDNEDGALFCEQCKSDLGAEAPILPPPAGAPLAQPFPEAAGVEETLPLEDRPFAPPATMEEATLTEEEAPLAQAVTANPVGEPPPAPPARAPQPPAGPVPPAGQPGVPAAPSRLPPGSQPKLVVKRGLRINLEYPLYEGDNFIGRADEKPVDIDLEDQEPPDRIWSSRQHALITFEDGLLTIEDLNSSNGTFVNRSRVYPGQRRPLQVGDVIQIGTVQMKVAL